MSPQSLQQAIQKVAKELPSDKLVELLDYAEFLRKRKKAFAKRWDGLVARLRKAAEKSGYRRRAIPRLIADVRSRARA